MSHPFLNLDTHSGLSLAPDLSTPLLKVLVHTHSTQHTAPGTPLALQRLQASHWDPTGADSRAPAVQSKGDDLQPEGVQYFGDYLASRTSTHAATASSSSV
ncbi:hypothetical protein EVG20_g5677 [Dentipellis fragilis]|uniref:Uncharacterized protein n=1 Tax=Dentipellis fragilis TaxID=205917 RepID=A0A4Y9YTX7_9AGAM|nr:hypothetical protein EVG20_g5677 [Dentipellis fragilis]